MLDPARFRIDPGRTVFAILAFEGPDVYSQAGGLGVRVTGLARALAGQRFETHLFFAGDPALAADETSAGGRLTLHRCQQRLSLRFPGGVYEGEDVRVREWDASLPPRLVDTLLAPALEAGRNAVVMGEEWQTARSMDLIDARLRGFGIRERAVLLWNANNIFAFEHLDWSRLREAATITTVSRYMKQIMWDWGENPIVIPNGIPAGIVRDPPPAARRAVREAAGGDLFCFKIGRFDPGKRWLMAIDAIAELRRGGIRVRLLARGDGEAHGAEVLTHGRRNGLRVEDVPAPKDAKGLVELLRANPQADVLNLITFLPERLLGTIYGAGDAVLANSRHEPFGLVGLEVMAAAGVAVTGSTGEDYAQAYRNAIVLETDDARELAAGLRLLGQRPGFGAGLRGSGRRTARDYVWERVIEQLIDRAEFAGTWPALPLPGGVQPPPATR